MCSGYKERQEKKGRQEETERIYLSATLGQSYYVLCPNMV